jgi:crotonobetainyl-CoA:carnitine CoA-transferase CaiB-like acyl-CoA transferase
VIGGRRVLEVTTGIGPAYASRLLADVGWDVVKVEPAEGDALRVQPSRWGGAQGANAGKRGVTVDAATLERLAAAADLVVGDFRPSVLQAAGLDAGAYEAWAPRAAVVSVSPFGLTGPRSTWAATELTVQAASGLMFLTGEADQQPQQLPPYQAELTGGLVASLAALAAARLPRGSGPHRLDISSYEAMAAHTFQFTQPYAYYGEVGRREPWPKLALRMVPTSDGYVYCAAGAIGSMRMDGIAQLLDEPRLADERFQTARGRADNWDEFLELFVPPFRRKTAQEWFDAAEALHMTFALVQTMDDLFTCPHLEARGLLHRIEPPGRDPVVHPLLPFRTTAPTPEPRPAPAAGQHTTEVLREWLG